MSGISLPFLVEPSTATGLTAISPNKVLGNVSSASAIPTAVSTDELTSLINVASTSRSGATIALTGNSTAYYAGNGTFQPIPAVPTPPPALIWESIFASSVGGASSYTISNLGKYQEIILTALHIKDNFGRVGMSLQVSTSNGASFVAANYMEIDSDGVFITAASMELSNSAGSGGEGSTVVRISAFNQPMISPYFNNGNGNTSSISGFINSTAAFNAIRLSANSGLAISGNIWVIGIPSS